MKIQWRRDVKELLDNIEFERVKKALSLLGIEEGTAIDSYVMSPNGPILSSIFVVTGSFLCEVPLGGKHLEFDVCPANLLKNYRVSFGEHLRQTEVQAPAEAPAMPVEGGATPAVARVTGTPFVTVKLRHTDELASVLSCFGDEANEWLDYVLKAYPVAVLV